MPNPEVRLALHHLSRVVRDTVPDNRQRQLALDELEVLSLRLALADEYGSTAPVRTVKSTDRFTGPLA